MNGYTFTGQVLAWGAARLRAGAQKAAGAVGPVEAFGLDECVSELSREGIVLSDVEDAELAVQRRG